MKLIFNFQKTIFEQIADIEFLLFRNSPGYFQKWRAMYLKFMKINFEDEFFLGHQLYIRNRGNLILGKRCCIGSFARIWNYAPIHIGDDFLAAGALTLNSATHDPVTLHPQGLEIKIGSRVWCGVNVTIVGGVTIGDDVVIGAGSVVVKDIPSGCIAAGVPAKKIRDLDRNNVKLWQPFEGN